jgi:osmotically inducible protein OsmC
MAIRKSNASWNGTLKDGHGEMSIGSGTYKGPYTFASRFEEEEGTNPEELIGAAHSGCFSMFLSALISNNEITPTSIETTATVHLGDGPAITKIELTCNANVPGIDEKTFQELVTQAKENCPVSKALAGVPEIIVVATLQN